MAISLVDSSITNFFSSRLYSIGVLLGICPSAIAPHNPILVLWYYKSVISKPNPTG